MIKPPRPRDSASRLWPTRGWLHGDNALVLRCPSLGPREDSTSAAPLFPNPAPELLHFPAPGLGGLWFGQRQRERGMECHAPPASLHNDEAHAASHFETTGEGVSLAVACEGRKDRGRGCPIVVSHLSYNVACTPKRRHPIIEMVKSMESSGPVVGHEDECECPFSQTRVPQVLPFWLPRRSTRVKPTSAEAGHTTHAVHHTHSTCTLASKMSIIRPRETKTLLHDVSFTALPGQVLAIVGSSGAGKSTLLDSLAGRISTASLQGQVLVNGASPSSRNFKRLMGYVAQEEALFPMLTPRETLMLSACLRLPCSIPKEEKAQRVDDLLFDLGLQAVADTRIGDAEVRGISGGEKRRVSIGTDLVHGPPVLLLDEPTSGLDSHAALNTLQVLRTMAKTHNRTVVLSIHQPSCRILEQIDQLLVLSAGMVAFFGTLPELETRLAMVDHPVPLRMNALEYGIEVLQSNPVATQRLVEASASGAEEVLREQEALILAWPTAQEKDAFPASDNKKRRSRFATSAWNEIWNLCGRNVKVMFRTKELCVVRAAQVALCALGLGTVFLRLPTSVDGIKERMGFLAFSVAFLLTSSMEALPLFLKERQVFVRETARGAYRLSSYQFASVLVFLPFLLLLALLFSAGSYWLVGLYPAADTFLFFVLVVWAALIAANSMVAFFAALAPDFITANSLIAGLMGGFFLFSGYFIPKKSIPQYWIWMYHLSIFKYPMEALLCNEYGAQRDTQFGLLTGQQILQQLDLATTDKWVQVAALFGFSLFYRLACYAALLFHGTSRR